MPFVLVAQLTPGLYYMSQSPYVRYKPMKTPQKSHYPFIRELPNIKPPHENQTPNVVESQTCALSQSPTVHCVVGNFYETVQCLHQVTTVF